MKPLSVCSALCLNIISAASVVAASEQEAQVDPTRPLDARFGQQSNGMADGAGQQALRVQAIFTKGEAHYAIVNNRVVSVGDVIEGATVKHIAHDSIQITTMVNGRETQRRLVLANQSDIKKHASNSY